MKSEELEHFLEDLLKEGVAVPKDEEFLKGEEERRKVERMEDSDKDEIRKVLTRGKLSDCKVNSNINRRLRGRLRKMLAEQVSKRQYQNIISRVSLHRDDIRTKLRKDYKDRVKWLKSIYGSNKKSTKDSLPDEFTMFKECNIFNNEHVMIAEKAMGPEIVLMEGEELLLSENKLEFLALGPKYCQLNTCSYEVMCC